MQTTDYVLLGIYVLGFVVAAVIATLRWWRKFDEQTVEGAAWGFLMALAWPAYGVVLPVYGLALLIARRREKQERLRREAEEDEARLRRAAHLMLISMRRDE